MKVKNPKIASLLVIILVSFILSTFGHPVQAREDTISNPFGAQSGPVLSGQSGKPSPAKGAESIVYHGNTSSHVFHKPDCKQYGCKNCTAVFSTREEAIKAGYKPCGICKP